MGTRVDKCRCCGMPIEESMTFGQMPIANAFIPPSESYNEYFFEMKIKPFFGWSCHFWIRERF